MCVYMHTHTHATHCASVASYSPAEAKWVWKGDLLGAFQFAPSASWCWISTDLLEPGLQAQGGRA